MTWTVVFIFLTSTSNFCLPTSNLHVALDRYVSDPVATVRDVAATETLSDITSSLRRDGTTWMLAKGAAEANQRRLIAATLAIDVAGVEIDAAPKDVAPLVDWACEQVRKRLPSDAERQWHIAALALLEGVGNLQAVEAHLQHAVARFPAEPQWQHTRAWMADSQTLNVHPRQPVSAPHIVFPTSLANRYRALTTEPALASDAWTRLGFLHFLSGQHADARSAFAQADAAPTADGDTRYLSKLFSAWMSEREGHRDDAAREFTAAMNASSSGRTAAVWLATRYQIDGRAAEARAIAARSLSAEASAIDPWRLFYRGDWRRWPALIAAARAAAQ